MNFITLDFETANSQRASACEIGLTFVKDWQIQETRSWLMKPPGNKFDQFNIGIHGIRPQDVEDKPEFCDLWGEIRPLIENQFIIAHNASFDFSVLRKSLEAYDLDYPSLDYACSYIFSKKVWAGLPSYDLKTLCRKLRIDFNHHRAGDDSRATAELSLRAFEKLDISSKDEFPIKLKTNIGRLYSGGYKPCETKREYANKASTKIVGDVSKYNPENVFYGKTVVFTGTLLSMVRSEAQKRIADLGGKIGNSVNSNTDILIVGQQDYRVVGDDGLSKKQEVAMKLIEQGAQIEVISEDEFLKCL